MAEGFFWGNDPNVNQQLRQRIAMAMMAKQSKYPKTFGEGLAAIGEAIGERGTMQSLLESDKAATAAGNARADELLGVNPPATGTNTTSDMPPATRTAYAPPGDVSAPPAAPAEPAAPTALAQPPDLLTTTPQPPSVLRSGTPTGLGGITPAAMSPAQSASLMDPNPTRTAIASRLAQQPAPQGLPYNMIDAQAGMPRTGSGRVQDALERVYPGNPDMQAYGSQLNAAEQPRAGDTSSTGARGPWQFTRGTARQYGLTNPDDVNASADALKALTADNAAAFERINGRPPSMAELALMHQQGGVTGARMAGGTGNASAGNLAVNNVPPGAGPAAAVDKIKGFYGLPDRAVDPRDTIAQRLLAQGGDTPPPPPAGPQLAFNGTPTDARAAVNPQQIRQAPPPASQLPPAGYISPTPADVKVPTPEPMSPTEAKLRDAIARNPNDEQLARRLAPVIQTLQANREAENARKIEQYKIDLGGRNTMLQKIEEQKTTAFKREQDAEKQRLEIQAAKLPKVEEITDKMERDPVTGIYHPPRVEGVDPNAMPSVKLTEDQRKTLTFHGWASLADKMMQDPAKVKLLAQGNAQELLGKVPIWGNQLQADEYRRVKNSANNFVLAFMRSTSGAAYGPKEAEDHARAMLPKPGDDAGTLADKAAQRKNFVDTLYGGLGPGRQVADYLAKQRKADGPDVNAAAIDERQKAIDEAMSKVKPLGFGDTRTNKKGVTRTWNGSHWVEM